MNNKIDRNKITDILLKALDDFSNGEIPQKLPRNAKSIAINKGSCSDYAYRAIQALLKAGIPKDSIKVYQWVTLHVFLVIDGFLYDSFIPCGVEFTKEKKIEFFIIHSIESGMVLNHYFTLLSGNDIIQLQPGGNVKIDNLNNQTLNLQWDKEMEINEKIYSVDEFKKAMFSHMKEVRDECK